MADTPKWEKQEEEKAEQEEKMKQQQRRERAKSDASDVPPNLRRVEVTEVFAILGISKSKDIQESEQKKDQDFKYTSQASQRLSCRR